MNRLKNATSPYLLQHADNPVDWYGWGDEAFEAARRREVPILLSVGYSACHWCHVMAHESFEDAGTARLMNELFVSVKVDREERPDVDAVYMEATQAMTGQGGWPMTVFMTPEGHPFYCGTYFPRPQFQRLLEAVSQAWRERRAELLDQGLRIVTALTERAAPVAGSAPPTEGLLKTATESLETVFDFECGGFGNAPKFPPSMVLEFLLRNGSDAARAMTDQTLEAMARGGIYDQLGGGFARYSVDRRWVVPHFEKMLYDNALLARVYAHWWRTTGSPLGRRIAIETCEWMIRDLRTDQGGFASALDADSEGVEGKYYVWTPDQLREILDADDAAYAIDLFDVTGTFEHGSSVMQLPVDPADGERFERIRAALLAARSLRVPPGRDDKVVAAWNGLAIAALAECGAFFDRADFIDAARSAADLIDSVHRVDGRLSRTSRDGSAGSNDGVLEDYADVAEGLLALYSVTGEPAHVASAGELLDGVLDRFGDAGGGFYDTADDAESLFRRPQDPTDNATPSGGFAAAAALLSYAALTGSARHREAAVAALGTVTPLADRHARFAGWGLAAAQALVAGPLEVAVVGPPEDPRTRELHRAALLGTVPGTVVALGMDQSEEGVGPARVGSGPATTGPTPTSGGAGFPTVPLLSGRGLVDGAPAAYVCRDFTCRLPVTNATDLAALIGSSVNINSGLS